MNAFTHLRITAHRRRLRSYVVHLQVCTTAQGASYAGIQEVLLGEC